MALVTGAECIYTRIAARRDPDAPGAGLDHPGRATPRRRSCSAPTATRVTEVEQARGLDRPLRVFPLFENALRFASGETIEEHQRRVSELWARFSSVAATNPYAWTREPRTASDEIERRDRPTGWSRSRTRSS